MKVEELKALINDAAARSDTAIHLEAMLSRIYMEEVRRRAGSIAELIDEEGLRNLEKVRRGMEGLLNEISDNWGSLKGSVKGALKELDSAIESRDRERMKRALRRFLESLPNLAERQTLELACIRVMEAPKRVARLPREIKLPDGWILKEVKARLRSRGLMGTRTLPWSALFDMGIFWDCVLQLPYYPGSTVKGAVHGLFFDPDLVVEAVGKALGSSIPVHEALARALLVLGVSDWISDVVRPLRSLGWEEDDLKKLEDEVRSIVDRRREELAMRLPEKVGEWRWSGLVIFFDAYPEGVGEGGWLIVPETIAPHYVGEEPKEHKVRPIPLGFLAVERGVQFIFPLAGRFSEDLGVAEELLKEALGIGIGAKTMSGYNVFEAQL
ncbi:MAG: type III-B CRISPR module RAMP protein Cmr6 [Candidatus Nezhaarchaeota archaeon]|nr:type III-B CRISPR module RAMP protein Cmr6 [Candidatus Nezhaarchaeota archaeon]